MDAETFRFNGPKYSNVNSNAFLITFIYSKASLIFLCLIGTLTSANIYLFLHQISNASTLCQFNDYLPIDKDVRIAAMPIVYYCRFLEFSIPTNIFQLLFCVAALFFALNRRSNLFIFCYSFLCLTLVISGVFFTGLLILNYREFIIPAIETLLWGLVGEVTLLAQFCEVLEPRLDCRMTTNGSDFDVIEQVCEIQRSNASQIECVDYLSESLMSKYWLIGLIIEYTVVTLTGIFVTIRAVQRRIGCVANNGTGTRRPTFERRTSRLNGTTQERHSLVQ